MGEVTVEKSTVDRYAEGVIESILRLRTLAAERIVLPLPVVVEEFDRWVNGARSNSWKRARDSLGRELNASIDDLPKHLKRSLALELSSYRGACRQALTADDPSKFRASVRDRSIELREALMRASTIGLAWDILIGEVTNGQNVMDAARAFVALSTILDLNHGRGDRRLTHVLGLLSGKDYRYWGPNSDDSIALPKTIEERYSLARADLLLPPRFGHCVVWLQYGFARIEEMVTTAGAVTIFDAPWAVGTIVRGTEPSLPHQDEMETLLESKLLRGESSVQNDSVFVRVDLGERRSHSAIEDAQTLVEELIAIAFAFSRGIRWKLNGSSVLLVDGEWAGTSHRNSNQNRIIDTMGMDETAEAFTSEAIPFARARAQRQPPHALNEAIRLTTEASLEDSREFRLHGADAVHERSALVLRAQAFEHLASEGGFEADALERRILPSLIYSQWMAELKSQVWRCLDSRIKPDAAAQLQKELTTADGFELHLVRVPEHLLRLLDLCESRIEKQNLRYVVKGLTDAVHYQMMSSRLSNDFTLLAGRHKRVRDALTHGNPVSANVVRSVGDFSRLRSGYALVLARDSFVQNEPFRTAIETQFEEGKSNHQRTLRGESLISQWENAAPHEDGQLIRPN